MTKESIKIEIITIPQAACDADKANWQQVVKMIANQLDKKYDSQVNTIHVEFMSSEWFEHEEAQKILENGDVNFPFVLINGELVCADKKINISKIHKRINELQSIKQ